MTIETLAIIPARGGSKGVPRKNLRLVGGIPLIQWSIDAARGSSAITQIRVSTEDPEIAAEAASQEIAVIDRPRELAADDTPMIPVLQHACRQVEAELGRPLDFICLLQPTAPMRTATDINEALRILIATSAASVVSVYRVEDAHPARMYLIRDGRMVPYEVEPPGSLRQQLPPVYHRNGAIYACRRDLLMTEGMLIGKDCSPYIMPKARSVNIDDEQDLLLADVLLSRAKQTT